MLPKNQWIKTVNRPYSIFYQSILFKGYSDERSWLDFVGFKYMLNDMMWVDGMILYPEYHMKSFTDKIVDKLFHDKKFFEELKEETLRREHAIIKSASGDVNEFIKAYACYALTIALYFVCDDHIESKLRQLLLKKASAEEVDKLMYALNIPLEDNFVKKEKLDLITGKNIDAHHKKYAWTKSRYGHINEYQKEDIRALLKSLEETSFLEEYRKEKEALKNAIAKAKSLLDDSEKYIVDVMQFFIYYRTQRTDVVNMAMFNMAPKLKEYAAEKGLAYGDMMYCTIEELDTKVPSKEVIEERKKGSTTIMSQQGITILTGKEHKKLKDEFLACPDEDTQLRGRTAYPGIVKGTAKIVMSSADISKVMKGDILVTYMTTTEMVPAMEKASAFVTDEGGITCHAAIVAREMKKPCIIGTGNATSVLKDGDRVEVDAEKGIVKKIQ